MAEHEQIDFDDELKRAAEAEPFTPFEIIISSGDRYEITQPVALAIGEMSVFVAFPRTGISYFRKYEIVSMHVREPA